MSDVWLKCSACRKDIGFAAVHWVCSVSTCNRNRTRLVFCSVPCWDSHVATLRHRDAWAVEARSPTRAQWQLELAQSEPAARPAPNPPSPPRPVAPPAPGPAPAATSAAGAVSATSPAAPAGTPTESSQPGPGAPGAAGDPVRRRIVAEVPSAVAAPGPALSEEFERDVLVVVSKMKKYIRERSGMNCSDAVADVLSEHLRALCDQSIRAASADGRKTVLDRDVPRPPRSSGA